MTAAIGDQQHRPAPRTARNSAAAALVRAGQHLPNVPTATHGIPARVEPIELTHGFVFHLDDVKHEITGWHSEQGPNNTRRTIVRTQDEQGSSYQHVLFPDLMYDPRRSNTASGNSLAEQRSRARHHVEHLDAKALADLEDTLEHTLQVMDGDDQPPRPSPRSGEPPIDYHHARTNRKQRMSNKRRELGRRGWSDAQQKRRMKRLRYFGYGGLVSGDRTRLSPPRTMTSEVTDVIDRVFLEFAGSRMPTGAKLVHVDAWLVEHAGFRARDDETGQGKQLPGVSTMFAWVKDNLPLSLRSSGKASSRLEHQEAPILDNRQATPLGRVGKVLILDSNSVDLEIVVPGLYGTTTRVTLVAGMDEESRSICGFAIRPGSENAGDVSDVIVQANLPKPLPDDLEDKFLWHNPDLSESELRIYTGGQPVADWPFFFFQEFRYDGGGTYDTVAMRHTAYELTGHLNRCHVRTPERKGRLERAFRSFWTLLISQLPGNTGADPSQKVPGNSARAVLTLEQLRQLITKFIITVWQRRKLNIDELPYARYEDMSPNKIVGLGLLQHGITLTPPDPYLPLRVIPPSNGRLDHSGIHADKRAYYGDIVKTLLEDHPPVGRRMNSRYKPVLRILPNDPARAFLEYNNEWWEVGDLNTPPEMTFGDRDTPAMARGAASADEMLTQVQARTRTHRLVEEMQGPALKPDEKGLPKAVTPAPRKVKAATSKQRQQGQKQERAAQREADKRAAAQEQVDRVLAAGGELNLVIAPAAPASSPSDGTAAPTSRTQKATPRPRSRPPRPTPAPTPLPSTTDTPRVDPRRRIQDDIAALAAARE